MYFKSRAEVGKLMASKLEKYEDQMTAVIALSPGAVIIGAQIAMRLHSSLMMLLTEKIMLPGEPEPIASMTTNSFTFNSMYSPGEIEEYSMEYHGVIEQQRIEKMHKLNKKLVDGAEVDPKKLRNRVVILVSDGLANALSLELAADYLKPIKVKKLIAATPIASVKAVDRMHLLSDEILCISVVENMMKTNHYYDEKTIPDHKSVIKITNNISPNWYVAA